MNAKDFATRLNGRAYRSEISKDEAAQASAAGLVVVYGASDDLMEFEGQISDEIGAYEGTTAYLNKSGLLLNECDNDDCPYHKREKDSASTIKALWCNEGDNGPTWSYKTEIPHETFDIFDGDEYYCRGIIFALKDV